MGVIAFIVILVVLIVVHEFGHFAVAKWAGMRVEEFGLGYPPRAATIGKRGETEYTLNWLPFGGFVRIYGEDDNAAEGPRAFSARPRVLQGLVLVAGVTMNLLLAYVLLTGLLVAGTPRALSPAEVGRAKDLALGVSAVLPGSPAAAAGIVPGDLIVSATDATGSWTAVGAPAGFPDFVEAAGDTPITLAVKHIESQESLTITPAAGLIQDDPSRYALGVEVGTVGVVPVPFFSAVIQGAELTWATTALTAGALWHFFASLFTGHADLSQVAGPVGIAGVVGSASRQGFGDLLSITALISINLAIINLLPIPALDGGRLLFVIIEGIIRRSLPSSFARTVNAVSFSLLILLMLVVTAHDIYKIVG